MQNKINYNPYFILILFIGLISFTFIRCANMQRPTGGPKDSIPPKILNVSPPSLQTNFKDKEIILTFDEYIKLSNQFKEFSISPDTYKQPEFKVKKKNLHILLPDSLEENTTYTINFGKGLVDFNEGNPIINYTYVFSTGNELDSLTISGSVINAFTKKFDIKEDPDVKVLLIPTSQDSIFGKKKANIFTTVDSSGNFTFKNLRENTYRIYALKEQNNDRIYNNPEELLGYLLDSIHLKSNLSGIKLEYSKGKPNLYRTTERKIEKDGRILLTFNQPIENPNINILSDQKYNTEKIVKYNTNKDSAFIFLPNIEFDSLKLQINYTENLADTVLLRRSKNDKYDKTLIPTFNINNKVDRINHIKITSKFPINNIDKEKIILTEDSIARRNFQLQKDSLNDNLYHIRFNWKPKKSYELVLQENAITSLFAENNKEIKKQFSFDEASNYGDITFELVGLDSTKQYVIEIIDEQLKNVFDKKIISNVNEITYKKFPGGKYTLRIYNDLNKNNRWDGANIYEKTQAEPIWYYDKSFSIRTNWEQTEKLNIQFE